MIIIENLYFELLNRLKSVNINDLEAEIITFKISDSNAWINLKIDIYQITGVFWKITYNNEYDDMKK